MTQESVSSRQRGFEEHEETLIAVKDLKVKFFLREGIVRAVDGVDFEIKRGRTLGVVGESGCGKSVTAMSVMRLIKDPPGKIVDGEIWLHKQKGGVGIDIVSLDPRGREIRAIRGGDIAMIFQEPMTSLNPLHTIGAQITETVMLHQKVGQNEAMDRAEEMLRKVRIAEPRQRLGEYPHQLSGGMRQRAMIAMALSCNPAVLIADEPTTALDVTIQAQILELMLQLQEDLGMAILIITHDLAVIAEMADQVAVMYMGKVVESSDVRTIFRRPLHPYTVGLMRSIPHLGRRVKARLTPIPGSVPDPYSVPSGCAFAPRCPLVRDLCRQTAPELAETGTGRSRCHFWQEVA